MWHSSSPVSERFFLRRRTNSSASSDRHSPESCDSISATSSDSRSSSSPSLSIHSLLLEAKNTYTSSRAHAIRCFSHRRRTSEEYSKVDVDQEIRCITPTEDIIPPSSPCSPLWASECPHECECKSRSTCPDFLQQHLDYLQAHESLMSAYYVSADEYARARDALSLPAAKLARARAEYSWAINRPGHLWAPRFQEQLVTAQEKITAAERDLEIASIHRWERAQFLLDIGRF